MEAKHLNNNSGGFSMVEMLAAVAIIVILLAISMVAAAGYRDLLKITELDNAAREIYMAAENRAVLLSGARRLSNQLGEKAPNSKFDYVSRASVSEELLPTGSIDPALRDGDFYIVYDRKSGSVTDVFYAESSLSGLVAGDFDAFYSEWAKSRSERLEMKDRMLVGWYSGQAAQGEEADPELPEEPAIKVMIENEEELTVTVEYTAPGPAALSVKLEDLELTGSKYDARKRDERTQTGVNGVTYTCTWVLDSLTAGKFKELGSTSVIPGGDFTVTAAITSPDGSFPAASGSDTNNSLFQEGSGGETAYIKYLRHLQNLDAGNDHQSGAAGKTQAIQTADIQGGGDPAYYFIPVFNDTLKKYDGRNHEIRNLHVNYSDDAGLFSKVFDAELRNIRMVNATVTAAGKTAGALAGEAHDTVIQNCWVYWEPDEIVADLKGALGSDADRYRFEEAGIFGQTAGGLVGVAGGSSRIMNCLAATLVKGEACAGGLVGQITSEVPIQNSYADCYLTGGNTANVAGLVGALSGSVTLTNCYAAGYIMGGISAAGLCLGTGTTTAENVYSAMRYPDRKIENTFTFLTGNQSGDSFTNTHFLGKDSQKVGEINSTSYDEMTSEAFRAKMGAAFAWKKEDSHPYNLREHLFLSAYSYPGLTNLPHYGDWGAEFKEPSLVYYEQYGDRTWGVSGGNARDLVNNLEDKKSILSDGYAVAFLQKDLQADSVTVTYTYWGGDGVQRQLGPYGYGRDQLTATKWANDDGSTADYYMVPLPDELVNSEYAQDCFYRYLKFDLELGGEEGKRNGEYFFNPHFAETVTPVIDQEGAEGGWTAARVEEHARDLAADMNGTREVKLRTPRHLYSLSRFREYYTRRVVFHQVLDLDYSAYTGYDGLVLAEGGKPFAQQPIGKWDEAFAGTYDGDCRRIKNVVFEADDLTGRRYAGLFGYSTGTLRNIVYEMNAEDQVVVYLGSAAEDLYVGALVGGNAGTVYNCAVSGANLRAGASGVSLYVGGLAGQNRGVIRNCAAESARLSANCFNYASIYIGGLVGENAASRTITTSYAVGRIDAEIDTTITTARICGFVGWNYGSVSNSYAAVDLRSSGDNVEAYGFCGVRAGSQSGTAYLDQGNFSYRDSAYAANYSRTDDRAVSTRYTDLAAKEKADNMGMGTVWQGEKPDPEREFPYPAAVKDGEGRYIHYGQWPEPMPLGEMGVFYWEKLVDAESGENPTYHMSALAVDPEKKTIIKQSTLSEAHDDGRVVVDYGYGYYSKGGTGEVKLDASNIGYMQYVEWPKRGTGGELPDNSTADSAIKDPTKQSEVDKVRDAASKKKEEDAERELGELMPEYIFHCWNSYHEGPRAASGVSEETRQERDTAGLVLFKPNRTEQEQQNPLDVNSGTFTLRQGDIAVTFIVNPQFAASLSVTDRGGMSCDEELMKNPGTADNPYQVRCGIQLQEINWHDTVYTDVPLDTNGRYVAARFPYLSGDGYTRKYYWKQTHDIDWTAEGNTYQEGEDVLPGVFFAVAQGRPTGSTALPGWFGGSYNGQNYTMKNLNIGINTDTYEVNSMGLFGAVQNAELENIVMYSESGTDVVLVLGRKSNNGASNWYVGGVLAGLALNSKISNCAVAGYTIRDETTYARTSGDVGGAIGGLVGMTDMDLTGCTAAAVIEIACNHGQNSSTAPVRVGGLVGSTTASVTNCYTGGTIDVSEASNASVYAGRLIGGVGVGPFGEQNQTASVENCYSYLTLPGTGGVVQEVYAIGGLGRRNTNGGSVTLRNNYYLSDAAGGADAQARAVTYQQLADTEEIDGQSIYNLLNAGQTPEPYSPVTSEVGGLAMAGRFSYAPKNRLDLQGMDYPFPTVLTQTRVSDGMVFNVHYGGWDLIGIRREAGGKPVELDLFTRPVHTETLKLSEDIAAGGTWSAAAGGDGVVAPSVGPDGTLTITAQKASDVPVTVTVTYRQPDGREYSLPVMIYVTARVELRPNRVGIFPNDTVFVPLTAWGKEPNEQTFDVSLADGTLTLLKAEGVSDPVSAEVVTPPETEPDAEPGIRLVRTGGEAGEARQRAEVTYTYTRGGYSKETVPHQIDVDLLELPEGVWSEDGTVWTAGFKDYGPESLEAVFADGAPEGFAVRADNETVILEKAENSQVPAEGVKLRVTLTMEELTHELTITVLPGPEQPTP